MENFPTYGSKYMREEIFDRRYKMNEEKVIIARNRQASVATPALTNRHYFKETLFERGGIYECGEMKN